MDTPGHAFDVAVLKNYAYIADGDSGLQVIDISNPSKPFVIGYVDTPGNASGIAVVENYAYVADGDKGLQIIDISNPSTPVIISSVDAPGYAVSVNDNYACVIYNDTLQIIDIKNPFQPIITGSMIFDFSAESIKVVGKYVYIVGDLSVGFQIIDISNPYQPILISSIGTSGFAESITVVGNYAYIIEDRYLYIVNIFDPHHPVIIDSIDLYSTYNTKYSYLDLTKKSIYVAGNYAYIAEGKAGLTIISINNLSENIIGAFDASDALDMAVVNNYAYLSGDGLQVVDISIPSTPLKISSVVGSWMSNNIAVIENYAYTIDRLGILNIIDISNPFNPVLINSLYLKTPNSDFKIKKDGHYLYIRYDTFMLLDVCFTILDISIPSAPFIYWQPTIDIFWGLEVLTIIGNYAYISKLDSFDVIGLDIVDISKLPELVIIGNMQINASDMAVSGNYAYLTGYSAGYYGFWVMDITDPSKPIIIGSVNTADYPKNIMLAGKYAYIGLESRDIQVIDISIPSKPVIIASLDTKLEAKAFVVEDKAIILDKYSRLIIIPTPVEIKPVNININSDEIKITLPNPQKSGSYTIRVFNNENEYSEFKGAVTFVPPEDSYLLDTKAIIIAGDKSGNNIRTETQTSADFAYQTLLFQGYTAESVNYLSFDTSQPGVDAKASLAAVSDAVNNWSIKDPKATELLIYLVGHGEDGYFVINDNEHLSVEQLDQWLDNLQNAYDIPVTVIYDACYSGSFLPKLTPPVGKKRVVISSASAAEKAYFPVSAVSFSYQFWNAVYQGNEIGKAFRAAANQMKTYQTAMMDADGDGIGTEAEIALAENMKIRRNYKPLTDVPYIYRVSDPQVLHDQTSAKITAGVSYIQDGTKVQRVWATVVPPDFRPDGPVANLPEIELTDPDGDGIYENTYTQFVQNGTYKINVCAMNQKGMFALFRDTTVVRETGYIAAVSQDQVISQNSAKIWAALKPDIPVTRVWVKIIPPISNGTPVETELSDVEHDGIYETVFSGFTADGTYIAELYAADAQGYTSPAVLSKITYGSGAGNDDYERDSTPELAGIPDFNTVQHHNFHTSEDTDWIKGFLSKDVSYSIRIPNRTLCLPAIDLLKQAVPGDVNSDKKTDLKDVIAVLRIVAGLKTSANIFSDVNRDGKIGIEEALYGLQISAGLIAESGSRLMTVKSSDASFDWTPPETGVYYFKISNTVPGVFGQNVTYDFGIYKATAGIGGTIRGTVKSPSGEPVSEAMIFTDDGGTDLSRDNGAFSITDSVGKRIITVQADGYEEYRTAVTVTETTEQFLNIVLSPSH